MKSVISFRLPRMCEDLVLGHARHSLHPDAVVGNAWHRLFEWYTDNQRARSFSSFARSFMFTGPQGFVSGNLIRDRTADQIEESRDWTLLYDLETIAPLAESDLAKANNGPGSTLLITSLLWQKTRPSLSIALAEAALGHLARWFEGNLINSVCFCLPTSVGRVIQPALEALDSSAYRLTNFGSELTFCRITYPCERAGIGPSWFPRLLARWPDPGLRLSKTDILIGRTFHEYEFDIWAAIQGSMPSWTVPREGNLYFDDDKKRSSSANQWRTRVGLDLRVNPEGNQRADTMKLIAEEFRSNPRLLTIS